MRILLVAATQFELLPLLTQLPKLLPQVADGVYKNEKHQINVLVTGVGMMHTAFALGQYFSKHKVDLAINLGIAGAFNSSLALGTVVRVISEQMGDLGVEEQDGSFVDLFQLGLLEENGAPFINRKLYDKDADSFDFLPYARGLTVNKVHGAANSIEAIQAQYGADIESMEGAAFFYACLSSAVPFLAIRSISNYVEPRNRANWKIELAIENLNQVATQLIELLIV